MKSRRSSNPFLQNNELSQESCRVAWRLHKVGGTLCKRHSSLVPFEKGGFTVKSPPYKGGFRGIRGVLLPVLGLFKHPLRYSIPLI